MLGRGDGMGDRTTDLQIRITSDTVDTMLHRTQRVAVVSVWRREGVAVDRVCVCGEETLGATESHMKQF